MAGQYKKKHFQNLTREASDQKAYNIFLSMSSPFEANIFYEDPHLDTKCVNPQRQEDPLPPIPYLQRGDSENYVDQFIQKQETKRQEEQQEEVEKAKSSDEAPQDEDYQPFRESSHKSFFHNFQKHLTVSLRASIVIEPPSSYEEHHEKAAARLWQAFRQSNATTKKLLHFILGKNNEHPITPENLKQFKLTELYGRQGEAVMEQAREFLGRQVVRQVLEGCVDRYLEDKRMKDKHRFKRYVGMFLEEVEEGVIRKRLSRDKIAELSRY